MSWLLHALSTLPFARPAASPHRGAGWLLMLGLGLFMALLPPLTHAQDSDNAIFVRADATTDPGNEDIGNSWENAYASLSRALQDARSGDEIWLAQGTYVPTDDLSDRDSSFVIATDIKIFGGFEGEEENFDERPTPVDPSTTVLSGDIDGDGTLAGNSYHVVVLDGVTNDTRLEGLTITGGNANETGNENGGGVQCRNLCLPLLDNVIVEGNYASQNGGGVHLLSEGAQVTPTLRNVVIRGNEAGQSGGGLHLEGGAVEAFVEIRVANTVLQGNRATQGGGLALQGVSSATVVGELYNTTIHGNEATDTGGGVYHSIEAGGLFVTNSILAGSEAGNEGSEVFQDGSVAASFEASLIQGAFEGGSWDTALGTNEGSNMGGNPLFAEATNPQNTPTTEGDVRLNWASPAIDNGVESLIPSDPLEETAPFYENDLAGNDRVLGNELDMGAYEGGITPTNATLFVDASASDDTGGSEWANPYRTLQGALQTLHNARAA
ncbi:MAG: choice-of-anchor Q domain-containing protein, partial [Bacteroidota bacterium]